MTARSEAIDATRIKVLGYLPSAPLIRKLCEGFTFVDFEGLGLLDYSQQPPILWIANGVEPDALSEGLWELTAALGPVEARR